MLYLEVFIIKFCICITWFQVSYRRIYNLPLFTLRLFFFLLLYFF